jgi:hypothetical protein
MVGQSVPADVFVGSVAAELATKFSIHPLDTLKTRLQYLVLPRTVSTNKKLPLVGDVRVGLQILAAATRSPHHSMIEPGHQPQVATHRLVGNALRSLYRGLGPQLIGVVPIALVYMPTYEFASAAVQGTYLAHTPLAGLATGVASATVRVPVSVVKSRMQLGLHTSMREAVRRAAQHGHGGLYAGFRATVVLDSCYAIVQFFFLEQLREVALRTAPTPAGGVRPSSPTELGPGVNAAIGFFTGVCAAIVTEPLDVIRTRLMTQGKRGGGAFAYEGLAHGLQKAVSSEGLYSLWKGLLPRLLTKSMGSVIWYTTYMEARRWFTNVRQV